MEDIGVFGFILIVLFAAGILWSIISIRRTPLYFINYLVLAAALFVVYLINPNELNFSDDLFKAIILLIVLIFAYVFNLIVCIKLSSGSGGVIVGAVLLHYFFFSFWMVGNMFGYASARREHNIKKGVFKNLAPGYKMILKVNPDDPLKAESKKDKSIFPHPEVSPEPAKNNLLLLLNTYRLPVEWVETFVGKLRKELRHSDLEDYLYKMIRRGRESELSMFVCEIIDILQVEGLFDEMIPLYQKYMKVETSSDWIKNLIKAYSERQNNRKKAFWRLPGILAESELARYRDIVETLDRFNLTKDAKTVFIEMIDVVSLPCKSLKYYFFELENQDKMDEAVKFRKKWTSKLSKNKVTPDDIRELFSIAFEIPKFAPIGNSWSPRYNLLKCAYKLENLPADWLDRYKPDLDSTSRGGIPLYYTAFEALARLIVDNYGKTEISRKDEQEAKKGLISVVEYQAQQNLGYDLSQLLKWFCRQINIPYKWVDSYINSKIFSRNEVKGVGQLLIETINSGDFSSIIELKESIDKSQR